MQNIYTVLDKIRFDERVNEEIRILKQCKNTDSFNAILSDFVFKNFCFGLIRDFDDEDERIEYLWAELICQCLNDGFLIIYESPVPCDVKMNDGKLQNYNYSWGYTQTNYIHLKDITQLSAVLSNLDDELIRREYEDKKND